MTEFLKKFLSETGKNQVIILMAAAIWYVYSDAASKNERITLLENELKTADSSYTNRLNRVYHSYQTKIDTCQAQNARQLHEQSLYWQAQYEKLFKETDKIYQKINSR